MSEDRPEKQEADRSRREFVAEAEEILEALSDDLRDLEAAFASRRPHRDRINTVFREVHSLKGFATLLGFPAIATLCHGLEDLLSRLRLGGELDGTILDLLHDTLDTLLGVVRDLREGRGAGRDLEALGARLARTVRTIVVPKAADSVDIDLPEVIRATLMEHEERRLLACRDQGDRLWLVRVRPDPQRLREDLEEMTQRIAVLGELLSTVPVVGETQEPGLAFDLLVASRRTFVVQGLPDRIIAWIREISPAERTDPGPTSRREDGLTAEPTLESPDDRAESLSSLRVPLGRLDDILSQTAELTTALDFLEKGAKELRERHPEDRLARDFERRLRLVPARVRVLQRSIMQARLVPVDQVFRKVGRLLARAGRVSGKEVDLHALGADTEMDRSVMDALTPALMHLVGNALDHGIETSDERQARGKPHRGRIVLSAFHRGSTVVIDVIDDGRGIDVEEVRRAAAARGLLPGGRDRSREEILNLVFEPGFSTARTVSEASGRGVGLDVVRGAIRRLKGTIRLRSVEGKGTTFSVTVPISLALVPAIIVRASEQRFAIPISAVRENLRVDPARVRTLEDREVYDREEGPLPLFRLSRLLRPAGGGAGQEGKNSGRYAIVTGGEGAGVGIVVDAVLGRQEVVVKPVGRWLRDRPGVGGAADLGDAEAVLVLDPDSLVGGGRDDHARP